MNGDAEPALRPADAAGIDAAAALLRQGRLVAFPTETVYGLGGLADDAGAIAAIFAVKRRPAFNPLIIHVADLAAAERLALFDARAGVLAAAFWPGPLTIVLPARPDTPIRAEATAGLASIALRVPGHAAAQALLEAVGRPVAAPSANRSGRVSPTRAADVASELGAAVPLILDGGPCQFGVESSVVDLSRPGTVRLLRPGGLSHEALAEVLGLETRDVGTAAPGETVAPSAPGQLASHYAPRAPVRLDAHDVTADEALLAFGPAAPAGAAATRNLSPRGDVDEAAHNLFAMLRELDRERPRRIAVMPVPEHGLGAAINDRLRRAASPRGATHG